MTEPAVKRACEEAREAEGARRSLTILECRSKFWLEEKSEEEQLCPSPLVISH